MSAARIAVLLAAALLAGCAYNPDAACTERQVDAKGERCTAWHFGPDRAQREAFDAGSRRLSNRAPGSTP
jgi:hypothetical protein